MEGFPMRGWSIEVYLLNENGEEVAANVFDKVIYKLHPSFEKRATQSTLRSAPPSQSMPGGWAQCARQGLEERWRIGLTA